MTPLYAFIHIPKCAGTTLAGILHSVYGKSFLQVKDAVITPEHFENIDLSKPAVILGHFPFGLLDKLTKRDVRYICFFREPFQRLLSYYTFILNDTENSKHAFTSLQSNFYTWIESGKLACLDNDMVRFMAGRQEINYDAPGDPVDMLQCQDALENLRNLAYIGLQEDFDRSLIGLADSLNWASFPDYENKRVQSKRRLVADLPDVTKELLNDTQKHDKYLFQEVEKLYMMQGE